MKSPEPEETVFDEAGFLRRVRLRSAIRTILLSLLVVMLVAAGLFVGTSYLFNRQENRIAGFYDQLVRYTEPNTVAIPGNSYDVGLLSRQKEYYLYRMVDQKPVPVGTVAVQFQIWGGEQIMNPGCNLLQAADGKSYLPPNMVPALQFYNPDLVGNVQPVETAALTENNKPPREFERLAGIPANDLVRWPFHLIVH